MNDTVTKWAEALESERYPQGAGRLYSSGKYCCWGVLGSVLGYSENVLMKHSYPPIEFLEQAGINRTDGPTHDIVIYLAGLNDEGSNFPYIASEIRRVYTATPSTDA